MEQFSKLRIDHNMTQLQVANYLGVSRTTYVKYETGNIALPLQNAVKLAELYNVTLENLLGIKTVEEKETPPAIIEDDQSGTEKRNIIRIAGRDGSIQERYLSDEQLSAVKSILDQLPDASDDL